MRTILLTLICLISLNIHGQTNIKLDQKNGFKTYKFGDPKSKYNKYLVENNWKDAYIFEYKPNEFNSIFTWQFAKMYLGFYNNKLGLISFYWTDNITLYEDILSKLEILYGKSLNKNDVNNTIEEGNDLISYNHWEGKTVRMTLRRYRNYSDQNCEDCKITLLIENKTLQKQKLESDF